MTSRPWWVVDAFTAEPFAGNPAAMLLLEDADVLSEERHKQIAAEANLSETAFVRPRDDGRFDLRWFTPTAEVDLCGHATLASGHVLMTERGLDEVRFVTRSGELHAVPADGGVTIDLPAQPAADEGDPVLLDRVSAALGAQPSELLGTGHEPRGERNLLAVFDDANIVRSVAPDIAAVAALPVGGVIVTAPGDTSGLDCVSRYFTPQYGIPEDPVTGAAHCTLGPYWAAQLGHDVLEAEQASARGGRLTVHAQGDRVLLTGAAVTVVSGQLTF